MPDAAESSACLLVIPAYEEHLRLPPFLRELVAVMAQTTFVTYIQIVDDGSSAESLRALELAVGQVAATPAIKILPIIRLNQRRGKGCAIRTGWESAKTYDQLAFVDADGAISAVEVCRLLEHALPLPRPSCCIAVRKANSTRSPHRGWSARLFTLVVNRLFHASFQDTQCGCKIISADAWQRVRARSYEEGFCFDLELLLLLRSERIAIEEIPINWLEKSGGHFRWLPDGMATLLAAIRLRRANDRYI
jgi:glycosyltransferase involved in cell wall biosynthesis